MKGRRTLVGIVIALDESSLQTFVRFFIYGRTDRAVGGVLLSGATEILADITASAIELMQENIALNLPSPSSTPVSTSAMPSPTMLYNASSASNAPGTQARTSTVKARVLDWDSPLPGWVGEASWPSLIMCVSHRPLYTHQSWYLRWPLKGNKRPGTGGAR
jgi:hypothetical protein